MRSLAALMGAGVSLSIASSAAGDSAALSSGNSTSVDVERGGLATAAAYPNLGDGGGGSGNSFKGENSLSLGALPGFDEDEDVTKDGGKIGLLFLWVELSGWSTLRGLSLT